MVIPILTQDKRLTFAIVTPSYNKAPYLRRCLLSVLQQQGVEVDYLVLDNCSSDGTELILGELLQIYPDRLRVIIEPDEGQSAAINKGFALTHADIMGWLNADDFYFPDTLLTVKQFFEAHPEIDVVYGQALMLDGNLNNIGLHSAQLYDSKILTSYNYIPQPSAFWRRRVWEAVGPLDTRLNWGLDWDFFIRVSHQFKVAHLAKPLSEIVFDGKTKTATGGIRKTGEFARISWRYGRLTNPTFWYCCFVLIVTALVYPLLLWPRSEAVTIRLVEKSKTFALTFLYRTFGFQVMS